MSLGAALRLLVDAQGGRVAEIAARLARAGLHAASDDGELARLPARAGGR